MGRCFNFRWFWPPAWFLSSHFQSSVSKVVAQYGCRSRVGLWRFWNINFVSSPCFSWDENKFSDTCVMFFYCSCVGWLFSCREWGEWEWGGKLLFQVSGWNVRCHFQSELSILLQEYQLFLEILEHDAAEIRKNDLNLSDYLETIEKAKSDQSFLSYLGESTFVAWILQKLF